MAIDTKNIPNKPPFDDIREALLDLEEQIDDTGGSVTNSTITITAGTNMTGGGSFTLNQSSNEEITLNASDQSMTDAEVKTAYENNSNTNAFTDSEKTKLGNISSVGSGSIITTSERTKLTSIEESADVTDTDNVTTAINSISVTAHNDVSNAGSGFIITATERTKLTNIEAGADVTDTNNVTTALGFISVAAHSDVSSAGSGSIITSTERTKLTNIEAGADVTDATNVADAGAIMDGDFTSNGIMKRVSGGVYATATATDINNLNIDADKLDGQHGSHYLDYNNLSNKPTIPSTGGIQDIVGAQFITNGSHTGISFSYDVDGDGAIDATISSDYKTKDQFVGNSNITISENTNTGNLEFSPNVRNLDVSPIVDGLAYYSDITTYFNSNSATIGFLDGGTVNEDGTISGGTTNVPSAREVFFINGTGIDLTFTENDTIGSGQYDSLEISAVTATTSKRGIIRLATDLESNNSNVTDRAITPAGLAYALGQNISTPNLQNVTTQGNATEDYIGIGDFDLLNNDDPLAPLHIRDNDTLKVILDNNSTTKSEIKFSDSASTSLYVGTNNGFGYVSQNSGNLSDAGISIKQTNGNVGIGVAVDDTQKLKVGGALLATGNISSSADVIAVNVDASGDVTAGANITLDADVGTVFATNATFSSGLDVTAGTSSLDGGIDVGANFNISNTGTITGTGAIWQGERIATARLSTDVAHLSGQQEFTGAKTFTQNVTALDFVLSGSDRRLKEDIQPIQKDSFDFEFKQYKYKGKDDLRYGVIAQDIEEKYPEFVKETEDGIKTVSYIDLLVAKVSELENRIKELENANT